MQPATPTEKANKVRTREIDLSSVAIGMMGKEWGAPEVEYEFSNGRKFVCDTDAWYREMGA